MQRQQAFSYANWRALTAILFTPRAIVERMLRWVQHQDVKELESKQSNIGYQALQCIDSTTWRVPKFSCAGIYWSRTSPTFHASVITFNNY